MESREGRAVGLVVAGAVLWGTGGITGAALTDAGVPTLAVAALRLGVGGGLLLVGLALAGRLRGTARTGAAGRRVLVTGGLAAVYQAAYFGAVWAGSVSVATLVALGGAPVLVAGVTSVRTRRRPPLRTVVALALALLGLVLLVGGPGTGRSPVMSAVLAAVCAAAFATMTIVNRTAVAGLPPLVLTGASFSLGAVLLVPVLLLAGGPGAAGGPGGLSAPAVEQVWLGLAVLWLGVGPTALAYAAYFTGLRSVPATTASLLALLEPLTAAVGAGLLRGERLGLVGAAGGALLLVAIVVLRPVRRTPTMARGLP